MVLLTVIGTGSKGNCYVLQDPKSKHSLVLEAGLSIKLVKPVIDYHTDLIDGLLITHEHKDHAMHVGEYQNTGIKVGCSLGTASNFKSQTGIVKMTAYRTYQFGIFFVIPFPVAHDASEPFGYLVWSDAADMGTMLFATDCASIADDFSDVRHFLIECNYDEKYMMARCNDHALNAPLYNRILESHMSKQGCIDFLIRNVESPADVSNVILCHRSIDNFGDEDVAIMDFKNSTGLDVSVAHAGMQMELSESPY